MAGAPSSCERKSGAKRICKAEAIDNGDLGARGIRDDADGGEYEYWA